MILTSTEPRIEGFWITAYKGIAQGQTWNEFLRHAEEIGANAVLNIRFDNELDVETLFHGAGVLVRPLRAPRGGGQRSLGSELLSPLSSKR